jgi:hypothetical protein
VPDAAVLPGRPDAPASRSVDRADALLAGRRLLVVVGALVLLRAVVLLGALPTDDSRRVSAYFTDGARYHQIASAEGTPYRDFEVEHPPVAVAFIELVDGDDTRGTLRTLGLASLALDLLTLAAVAYGFGRRAALAYLVLSTPFLFLPFIYFRVDLLVVALAVWGLALVKRGADAAGGGLLALAVFSKLWPLAVLPVVVVAGKRRAAISAAAVGLAGGLGWFLLGGVGGIEQVVTFRGARGFQIESIAGGVARLFTGEFPRRESGALRTGNPPFVVTLVLGALMVLGVAWVWWRVHRTREPTDRLLYGIAPLTAVTIFMVCSPLLSPQYLVWLVPFGALAWVYGERAMAALVGLSVVATMVLTQVYGPLNDGLPVGHAALAFRNALLLAIITVGVVRIRAVTSRPLTSRGEPVHAHA